MSITIEKVGERYLIKRHGRVIAQVFEKYEAYRLFKVFNELNIPEDTQDPFIGESKLYSDEPITR